MSHTAKDNIIFGNALVRAPDGTDMFRCKIRLAEWYLKKELAKEISHKPLVIQLLF